MRNSTLGSLFLGLLLIGCGLLWLVTNFIPNMGFNFWGVLWPVFVLFPGIFLLVVYYTTANRTTRYGLWIPITLLIGLSITFFVNSFFEQVFHISSLWVWTIFSYPGWLALGFIFAYLGSGRKRGFLIPAAIMGMISVFLLCMSVFIELIPTVSLGSATTAFWPFLFICFGLFVLISPLWWWVFRDEQGRVAGKSEDEWKVWGENFGEKAEKWGKEFGAKAEKWGDEFGQKMEGMGDSGPSERIAARRAARAARRAQRHGEVTEEPKSATEDTKEPEAKAEEPTIEPDSTK